MSRKDEMEKIHHELLGNADIKCNREIKEVQIYYKGYEQGINDFLTFAKNLPDDMKVDGDETARNGEWLNPDEYDEWHCSECGFEINYDGNYPAEYDNFKYCGRCGAKMDGDKNV